MGSTAGAARPRFLGLKITGLFLCLLVLGVLIYRPFAVRRLVAEGVELWEAGRHQEALSKLEAARRWDPRDAEAWWVTAEVNQELERNNEALRCFRRAIELDPNNADYHASLGLLYFKLRDFKKAEPVLKEAVRLDPKDIHSLRFLALICQHQKRMAEARIYAIRLHQLGSHDPITRDLLGK